MRILKNILLILLALLIQLNISCRKDPLKSVPDEDLHDETFNMESIGATLSFKELAKSQYELSISTSSCEYIAMSQNSPIVIDVYHSGLIIVKTYNAKYSQVTVTDKDVTCSCIIRTDAGSIFNIKDVYKARAADASLEISREIKVSNPQSADYCFNSMFGLQETINHPVDDYEILIPSLVYKDASGLTPGSIGSNLHDSYVLAREERMALPYVMIRNRVGGNTLTLINLNSSPETFKGDFGTGHQVNSQMKYASLGLKNDPGSVAAFICYPGSEGEKTYSDGSSVATKRWAKRSHPVKENISHNYTVIIKFDKSSSFAQSVENSWKYVLNLYNPPINSVTIADIHRYSLEVLGNYWMNNNGAPGFPFTVKLPGGEIDKISYDMGFVGMQISCAYYLYRDGLEKSNSIYMDKGEQIINFWAENCLMPSGLPRTWYDYSPRTYRNPCNLREMQGGMEAIIWAWSSAKQHGIDKTTWLDCCIKAGNWMVDAQNGDGSWYATYYHNGSSGNTSKYLTSNLVRFLTYLYKATGDERYKMSVLKAGEYCYNNMHAMYNYSGSVIDNPGVKDRESGQKAIEAFLALFDLTEDNKWLEACRQAAVYTATYMYSWNIPMENGDNPVEWPSNKGTSGLTIIATGHSGADNGLSYNSFEYFRLYLLTDEECFMKVAKILEKNAKQSMNYDGILGYLFRGLQTEAIRVVTPRGYGVKVWLPWTTAANLDPMLKFKDAFGEMEIDNILNQPLSELKQKNTQYGQTMGILRRN